MLNIDIGCKILQVLIPLSQTKFLLIKLLVALQSRSALIEWTLLVLVVHVMRAPNRKRFSTHLNT